MPSRDDNYVYIRVIGRGAFGVVELWRQKFNEEKLVAAKRIHVGEMSKEELEQTRQEAQLLKALQHPHIVQYMGSWMNRQMEDLIIVQDYCDGGDLAHYVFFKKKSQELIPETSVVQWLAQLTHALLYCHKKAKILHRDLKPTNVFLTEDLQSVRLGDFGIAKSLKSTASLCQTVVGTQAYMSPELTRMQRYGIKTEVWSLGATLYEMCVQEKLYDSPDVVLLVQRISSAKEAPRVPVELGFSTELQELCASMLVKDPSTRPNLSELLQEHELLRLTVLQLERSMDWTDSLVESHGKDWAVPSEAQEKLREVFAKYSKEGLLSRRELTNLLQRLHPKWASGVAALLLKAADANGDETLDCEEFLKWLFGGEKEWDPIKQALVQSTEEPEPRVEKPESFTEMASEARVRLLKSEGKELSLQEAAGMKELHELLKSHKELQDVLKRFPVDPVSSAMSILDFSSWSVARLKDFIHAEGGSAAGATEKQELVDLCSQLFQATLEDEAPDGDASTEAEAKGSPEEREQAMCIDARLRCIRLLQDQGDPDPVELAVAVRQARKLLKEEPCETAIVSHSQRLGMRAEDRCSQATTAAEMEQAVDLMRAVKDSEPPGAPSCVTLEALQRASARLRGATKELLGVRSQCGPFVKTCSLPQSTTLAELKAKLALLWTRPVENLRFFAKDGAPLESEDQWQELKGSKEVEVNMVLERKKKGKDKGKEKARAPSKPRPDKEKKSLAGLAASSSPWRA